MERENHNLANTTAIIVSGKKHQHMLKLVGKRMISNRVFTLSQSVSPQDTY